MGPTWALSAPDGPHDGPMNLAIRVALHEAMVHDTTAHRHMGLHVRYSLWLDDNTRRHRCQAITRTNIDLLPIGPFNEILIKLPCFSLSKMHRKMMSTEW